MTYVIKEINKNIFKLSDAMILAGNAIKKCYAEDSSSRSELFTKANKISESIFLQELKKISNYNIRYEDTQNNPLPERWCIEGLIGYNQFLNKKGKISFEVILTTPEIQYDEMVDKHIFTMRYYPLQDEITYDQNGIGRFKIEKASGKMKKIVKIGKNKA